MPLLLSKTIPQQLQSELHLLIITHGTSAMLDGLSNHDFRESGQQRCVDARESLLHLGAEFDFLFSTVDKLMIRDGSVNIEGGL